MRTRSNTSLAIVMIVALLLLVSCASSRTAATDTRVDPLFAMWNRQDSPGCGVGVSRNGEVIFERGYGMASLERRLPITSATVFPLASITKSFTAMSVLLAADRGLLSLDDEVSKYIADWSDRDHKVTIRHLLTHTSGLRDAYVLQGWAPKNGSSNDAILKILARQRGLNFDPGAEYQYNNGGYLLLGKSWSGRAGNPSVPSPLPTSSSRSV